MLYAVRKGGSSVGYCSLSIRCGTRDEEGYSSGIAHFVEHTLFKGTSGKKASTINSYLDKLGGELNAYTTKEEIVLHATVLKEDLRKAGSLLMELATSPSFPEKEVNTERGVVIDEIRSYKDLPSEDIYDRFEERLFKEHPLSRPILGTEASVRGISSKELLEFVRDKFVPQAMAFTIVSGMEEKAMERLAISLISKFFPARFEGREIAGTAPEPSEYVKALAGNKFDIVEDKRNHEVNAVIGGLAPSLYDEKARLATILLSNILAGPASNSILNLVLREKHGWVYAVESSYTQYSDTGILALSLGCDKSNLDNCMAAIHKEILKLQTIPLSPKSLKAAKKQLLGQLAISSDNGEAQCLSMGKSLLAYGHIDSDKTINEKIDGITSEDILNMAVRIFNLENISKLVYL